MDNKKDILDQFEELRSAWDEAPPPSAWDRLESRLDANPAGHAGRPWKPFVLPGLGIVFLVCLLGGIWLSGLGSEAGEGKVFSRRGKMQPEPRETPSFTAPQDTLFTGGNVPLDSDTSAQGLDAPSEQWQAPTENLTIERDSLLEAPQYGNATPQLSTPPNLSSLQPLSYRKALPDGNTYLTPQVDPNAYRKALADQHQNPFQNPDSPPLEYRIDPTYHDLGDNALHDYLQQRHQDRKDRYSAEDLEELLPFSNVAPYDYGDYNINPGDLVVTNHYGNVMDTVRSITQYLDETVPVGGPPPYLQMNGLRNDMEYAPRGRTADPAKLEHFNWLLGSWKYKGPSGAADSFEKWDRRDAFNIEGRGFFILNGDTVVTERMRIEQKGPAVYYIAAVDTNQNPMRFRLRSRSPGEAVFRNDGDQGPRKLILRKSADGTVETIFQDGRKSNKNPTVRRSLRPE